MKRWLGALAGAAGVGALLWAERRWPLRRQGQPGGRRLARNVAVAASGGVALRLIEQPIIEPLARRVERERLGLLQRVPLPRAARITAAVLALDYTLFVWHYLNHRVPLLWRFHLPHHVDLDMDASTALRFHAGELTLSVAWRAAQVRGLGIGPRELSIWQTLTVASILFHHSNLRLPRRIEAVLARLIVTPRLHGIHHSRRIEELNSNWSSGVTLWDWLHGTLRLDLQREAVDVGVEPYRAPEEVTLREVLALPFRRDARMRRALARRHPGRHRPAATGSSTRPAST